MMGDANRGIVGPALFILVGLATVAGGAYLYYSGLQATEGAEAVDATVVTSNVVDRGVSEDGDRYSVYVEYRYTYEGETYTSTSICPGAGSACAPSSDSRSDVEGFLDDYPEGETVTAYVSPSDPSSAYLVEKNPSLIYLGVSAFGLVFALLGGKDLVSGGE